MSIDISHLAKSILVYAGRRQYKNIKM